MKPEEAIPLLQRGLVGEIYDEKGYLTALGYEAFIHGEDYIKKYVGLIELEFRNSLKEMTENDWEMLIKAYIKALTEKESGD